MISNAFKSAYQGEQGSKLGVVNTATQGIKSLASGVIAALGFASGLGASSNIAQSVSRLAGIGGGLTDVTLGEKQNLTKSQLYSTENAGKLDAALFDLTKKYDDSYDKAFDTVWNKLNQLKVQEIERDLSRMIDEEDDL